MIESISEGAAASPNLKRTRRKAAGFSEAAPKVDRLPPHSPEAEQGVLGCILLSPESCIAECLARLGKRKEFFYDLRHQVIYETVLRMSADCEAIDMITLQSRLKKQNCLDECGGLAYLTSLPDSVPSAANLSYYLEIVFEKWELRKIIQTCTEVVSRVYDYAGPIEDLKFSVQSDLGEVFGDDRKTAATLLSERRYDPSITPPELRAIYTIQSKAVSTPGNITTITSAIKTGKSAVVSAMAASVMAIEQGFDLLSFGSCNPDGRALVWIDTEQSRDDGWHCVTRSYKRAGLAKPPAWLNAYFLAGREAKRAWKAVLDAVRIAIENHGGIHSVLIDGVADLVRDVNDPGESNDFVAQLHDLAISRDCPVIGVIHFNPGSDKSRGHLGSQLERKAESNLRLDKTADVTCIWSDKQRRSPIPKETGPCFRWDDGAGMHISTDSRQRTADADKVERYGLAVEAIFQDRPSMRYKDLIQTLTDTMRVSSQTAERRLSEMVRLRVITKAVAGLYTKGT